MNWVILALGIIFEVLGTVCMKLAEGFSKWVPSVFVFVFYGLALLCLIFVLKKMEMSIAYAVWASMGIVLISFIGIVWFRESVSFIKILSIILILAGILGLELLE